MATAYVQSTSLADFFNSTTTIARAFQTQNIGSGSVLAGFALWSSASATISSVTDSAGNTYTVVAGSLVQTGGYSIQGFYVANAAGNGTKPTVTVTFSSAVSNKCIALYEISGADTTAPLDGSKGTNVGSVGGGTNTVQSGNWTTTENGCLLIAAMASLGFSGTTITAGTTSETYTRDEFVNANSQCWTAEHASQATASSATVASFSTSAFTGSVVLAAMAFKPASGVTNYTLTADAGASTAAGTAASLLASGSGLVDVYCGFEVGSDGDTLTTTLINAGMTPGSPGGTWADYDTGNGLAIATAGGHVLGRRFNAAGTFCPLVSSTRGARFDHNQGGSYNAFEFGVTSPTDRMSIGFLFKTGLAYQSFLSYTLGQIVYSGGGEYSCFNLLAGSASTHTVRLETWDGVTNGPDIVNDTAYWITLLYDKTARVAALQVFNPSTWAPLGDVISRTLVVSPPTPNKVTFGVTGGNFVGSSYYSYYNHLAMDWTRGDFPLLPKQGLGVPLWWPQFGQVG